MTTPPMQTPEQQRTTSQMGHRAMQTDHPQQQPRQQQGQATEWTTTQYNNELSRQHRTY